MNQEWHVQLVMQDETYGDKPFIHHCFVTAATKQEAARAARAKAKVEYRDSPGIEYVRVNSVEPDDGIIVL